MIPKAYEAAIGIGNVFATEAQGLDWTVFRIGAILGGCDEASWREDRQTERTYAGPLGAHGWSISQKRAGLTRWLVDEVEIGLEGWVGKMPAVSSLSGGKWKVL
jgi:hypothetical protein